MDNWWLQDETVPTDPPEYVATLENLSSILKDLARVSGLAFEATAEMLRAMHIAYKDDYTLINSAVHIPSSHIPPVKHATGPRPKRRFDHRGRKRY